MPGANLVDRILRGAAPGESALDLMILTQVMAEEIATGGDGSAPTDEEPADGVIELAATILCPLFDPVKPASYSTEMTEVRQQYAGLADDEDLRNEYRAAVRDLARQGHLATIEVAVEENIWQNLGRRRAASAGA